METYFAAFPTDFEQVGDLFIKTYYGQLQTDRNSLAAMYHSLALMTYEGRKIHGQQAIAEHFKGLSWNSIAVSISCSDCQPVDNGYLVFVSGQFRVDNDEKVLPFSETFLLKKIGDAVAIVHSMFRLSLHNR